MNPEKISEILILRFLLLMMNPEPQVLDLPYSTGVYMMYVCVIIIHSMGTLDVCVQMPKESCFIMLSILFCRLEWVSSYLERT